MEKLKLDLIQLNNALKTLKDSVVLQQEVISMNDARILLATEDSTIQRFEYTYESFWKVLKIYLELVHHLGEMHSPKKVFRACVQVGICTLEEGSIFIDMADSRNETSHTYSIESSRVILPVIPTYYDAMMVLVNRLNREYGLKID